MTARCDHKSNIRSDAKLVGTSKVVGGPVISRRLELSFTCGTCGCRLLFKGAPAISADRSQLRAEIEIEYIRMVIRTEAEEDGA